MIYIICYKFRYLYSDINLIKTIKMAKDQVLGIVRHVLTFVGGILVVKGLADDSLIQEIIGGVSALIGSVWSIVAKKK